MKELELLIDSHHGIYIPYHFAKFFNVPENFENYEEIKEDLTLIQNFDIDNGDFCEYWESWDFVGSNAILINKDGVKGYLYEDCNLFFCPEDYEHEDF